MSKKFNNYTKYLLASVIAVALVGCFKILSVVQPSDASVGEQITSTINVKVDAQSSDATPHYGIVGLLVPNDWTINSVTFSGGYTGSCSFLPPDSSDAEPGGQMDYWADTLEVRYPSGPDMKWMVYQSDSSHLTIVDTLDVTVNVNMTVGNTQGKFNLGYFVSDAALDFSDSTWYSASLNHTINVTGVVPVELTSFAAKASNNSVMLNWSTSTETNNKGFVIERSTNKTDYARIGFVNGAGSSTQMHQYGYTDSKLTGGKYYYRLKQLDLNGQYKYSKIVEVNLVSPTQFSLSQNYPNPFNPSTSINFSLPSESHVMVRIYNTQGQELSVIAKGNYSAGEHSVNFDASRLASGTYIYSITATGKNGNKFVSSKKMILLK